MARSNANSRATTWLMGVVAALIVLGATGWATALNGKVSQLEAITASQGERLAAQEAYTAELRDRLIRIEDKIDRLIEAGK